MESREPTNGKPQRGQSVGGLAAIFSKSRSNSRNNQTEASLTGLSHASGAAITQKSSPTTNRPQSSSSAFAFNDDAYWTQRLDSGRSNTVDSTSGLGSTASGDSGDGEFRRIVGVDTFIDNVLYNVVDNYAAILSCALIHSEIVEVFAI